MHCVQKMKRMISIFMVSMLVLMTICGSIAFASDSVEQAQVILIVRNGAGANGLGLCSCRVTLVNGKGTVVEPMTSFLTGFTPNEGYGNGHWVTDPITNEVDGCTRGGQFIYEFDLLDTGSSNSDDSYLSAVLTDSNNGDAPIANREFLIHYPNGSTTEVTTNGNGNIYVGGLPFGDYQISEKTDDDYDAPRYDITVSTENTISVDLSDYHKNDNVGNDSGNSFDDNSGDINDSEDGDIDEDISFDFDLAPDTDVLDQFNDLIDGAWYEDGLSVIVKNSIMNGISEHLFAPNMRTNRAMFVTVLYRLYGSPVVEQNVSFDDVEPETYYMDAVKWGIANDIIKGYDVHTFGPNDAITREQAMAILYRLSGSPFVSESDQVLGGFADFDEVDEYAQDALAWGINSAIIDGISETELAPRADASRVQIAIMIYRYMVWSNQK